MAYEKHQVLAWIDQHFGQAWASECDVAFTNKPISCVLATSAGMLQGFACYDSVARGFFGPIGVSDGYRGRGLGHRLLLHCLHDMRMLGYGYAIIGGAADPVFYERAVGALSIPDSSPGLYRDRLIKEGS